MMRSQDWTPSPRSLRRWLLFEPGSVSIPCSGEVTVSRRLSDQQELASLTFFQHSLSGKPADERGGGSMDE